MLTLGNGITTAVDLEDLPPLTVRDASREIIRASRQIVAFRLKTNSCQLTPETRENRKATSSGGRMASSKNGLLRQQGERSPRRRTGDTSEGSQDCRIGDAVYFWGETLSDDVKARVESLCK